MTAIRIPALLPLALAAGLLGACAQAPSAAGDAHADATAATPAEAVARDHHHDLHADLARDYPVPVDHVPWTPDAPLVDGMARVRAALDGLDPHAAAEPAVVRAAADEVDAAIDDMFANCRLDPEPDIALHAVLARLMAGSERLREHPADTSPVADMQAAVANYARLFDDPSVPVMR